MLIFSQVPVSPNATDPTSWGTMIERVGIPMGILILFGIMFSFFLYIVLRWMFGESKTDNPDDGGFVRVATRRWFNAQIDAFNGIRTDIDALKVKAEKEAENHHNQEATHRATINAGHHALNALTEIGIAVRANVEPDLKAAHESLNQL